MQSAAWDHASPFIKEFLTLRNSVSEYEQNILTTSTVAQLSVADAIVLVHCMGVTDAARFVSSVDPWCYPGNPTPASINVKFCIQSTVDKATSAGRKFYALLAENVTAHLLSPLLLPKGERPLLLDTSGCKKGNRAHPTALHPVVARARLTHNALVEVQS
jgi:hypothetical protein